MTECRFITEAFDHGLSPSLTLSPDSGYDVVVDNGTRLLRVQVKTATTREGREGPMCEVKRRKNTALNTVSVGRNHGKKQKYTEEDCDFFAVYVRDGCRWFIIPVLVATAKGTTISFPAVGGKKKNTTMAPYCNAWYLLTGKQK